MPPAKGKSARRNANNLGRDSVISSPNSSDNVDPSVNANESSSSSEPEDPMLMGFNLLRDAATRLSLLVVSPPESDRGFFVSSHKTAEDDADFLNDELYSIQPETFHHILGGLFPEAYERKNDMVPSSFVHPVQLSKRSNNKRKNRNRRRRRNRAAGVGSLSSQVTGAENRDEDSDDNSGPNTSETQSIAPTLASH
ncbi:unnamed protein product [Caenorhabditis bovis]|uniref:Uncharacterized protein n=1 Tax=Caenorhabditis bovis TaxID=2654633 RepID=A0A8S1E7L2_9PELO|nr:unnamed protein product [Caenorhabditis bovis]